VAFPARPRRSTKSRARKAIFFLDLCELLGVPKPGSAEDYRFEEKSAVIGGKTGYADVFKRGIFAWENKAPGKKPRHRAETVAQLQPGPEQPAAAGGV